MITQKLTVVFATLNPDYSWTPREEVFEVSNSYTQNKRQCRETAEKLVRPGECVYSCALSPEKVFYVFRANRAFEAIDYDGFPFVVKKGEMVDLRITEHGIHYDSDKLILYSGSSVCIEYVDAFLCELWEETPIDFPRHLLYTPK